jgi:hypothetical protein
MLHTISAVESLLLVVVKNAWVTEVAFRAIQTSTADCLRGDASITAQLNLTFRTITPMEHANCVEVVVRPASPQILALPVWLQPTCSTICSPRTNLASLLAASELTTTVKRSTLSPIAKSAIIRIV